MNDALCAYQGAPGAFSEEAAWHLLSPEVSLLPCDSFVALFDAVTSGRARWGVVPIENSLVGAVHDCHVLLAQQKVKIVNEARLRVSHALIAAPGAKLADIRQALSHPVALQQCRRFFQENPAIVAVPSYDTAGAVREVMHSERHDAAIAGARCAAIYGGSILMEGIEDSSDNYTRFLLITAPQV